MRNNAEIMSANMPRLAHTFRIGSEKDRQKSARIELTSEEIEAQIAEFLSKGGEITHLPYGARRDV